MVDLKGDDYWIDLFARARRCDAAEAEAVALRAQLVEAEQERDEARAVIAEIEAMILDVIAARKES